VVPHRILTSILHIDSTTLAAHGLAVMVHPALRPMKKVVRGTMIQPSFRKEGTSQGTVILIQTTYHDVQI
jgi:hypothetical protein